MKENSRVAGAVPKIIPLFLKLNAQCIWRSESGQNKQTLPLQWNAKVTIS